MATMSWKSGRFEWLRKLQQFNDNTRSVEVHCDAFPFFCDWVGIEPFPSLREVGGCLQGVDEAQGWPSFVVALNDENRVVDVISSRGEEKYLYVQTLRVTIIQMPTVMPQHLLKLPINTPVLNTTR